MEQCDSHLESFALSVDRLKALIVKDLTNLSLVMHEPELWQRLVTSVSYHREGELPMLVCQSSRIDYGTVSQYASIVSRVKLNSL